MWHNSVMTRRPRKCFDDIGDRFDRSLAYEEIGFTRIKTHNCENQSERYYTDNLPLSQ